MNKEELLSGLNDVEKKLLGDILIIEKKYQHLPMLSQQRDKEIVSEISELFKRLIKNAT